MMLLVTEEQVSEKPSFSGVTIFFVMLPPLES